MIYLGIFVFTGLLYYIYCYNIPVIIYIKRLDLQKNAYL